MGIMGDRLCKGFTGRFAVLKGARVVSTRQHLFRFSAIRRQHLFRFSAIRRQHLFRFSAIRSDIDIVDIKHCRRSNSRSRRRQIFAVFPCCGRIRRRILPQQGKTAQHSCVVPCHHSIGGCSHSHSGRFPATRKWRKLFEFPATRKWRKLFAFRRGSGGDCSRSQRRGSGGNCSRSDEEVEEIVRVPSDERGSGATPKGGRYHSQDCPRSSSDSENSANDIASFLK